MKNENLIFAIFSATRRSLAQNLNLTPVRQEELGHVVFGGLETKKEMHAMYNITVSNLQGSFKISMEVLDEDRICGYLPRAHDRALLDQLRALDISLTDVGHDIPEISLLIGADYSGLLLTSKLVQLNNGLTAVQTKLGWTLQGVTDISDTSSFTTNLLINDINDLWNLESLGIRDPAETKSIKQIEDETLLRFEKTVTINQEGRYEVSGGLIVSEALSTEPV